MARRKKLYGVSDRDVTEALARVLYLGLGYTDREVQSTRLGDWDEDRLPESKYKKYRLLAAAVLRNHSFTKVYEDAIRKDEKERMAKKFEALHESGAQNPWYWSDAADYIRGTWTAQKTEKAEDPYAAWADYAG